MQLEKSSLTVVFFFNIHRGIGIATKKVIKKFFENRRIFYVSINNQYNINKPNFTESHC